MPHSLNKSIEARKLNPRTLTELAGHDVTIPYGSLLDGIERSRDTARFRHLGELYACPFEVLASALDKGALAEPPAAAARPAAPATAPAELPRISWRQLESSGPALKRAKVPGGWLVASETGAALALAFYPDPDHRWDGTSLPD